MKSQKTNKTIILAIMTLMLTAVLSVTAFAQGGEPAECSEFGLDEVDESVCDEAGLSSGDSEDHCDNLPPNTAPCIGFETDYGDPICCDGGDAPSPGAPCVVQGTIEVPDFSDDIECKLDLWNGEGTVGEGDFDCVRVNELFAHGLVDGEGNIDGEGIRGELRDVANDGEGAENKYITRIEIDTLRAIANDFGNKLEIFQELCTGGEGTVELDASEYLFCKKLLADMKKELGEASKIVWYTPDVFWKVQILEDIQENLDHILAKFDEAAREAFTVDCTCDKGVELSDYTEPEGTTIFVELIGDANSADVTLKFDSTSCDGSPSENCKLVNEFQSAENCIQVYDCTNSETDPGEIYVTGNGQVEVRAVAHGPCGKEGDRNLDNNYDQKTTFLGTVSNGGGITGGAVVSTGGVNVGVVSAVGVVALIIGLFMLAQRKKN